MSTTLARELDGIPTVIDTVARDRRFPAPELGQKVFNVTRRVIERYGAAGWEDALAAPVIVDILAALLADGRVTLGQHNSGGPGFRVLRVPNP